MIQYEALDLSPEQVEKLAKIAATYTAAGRPTSIDHLVNFVFSPTKADLERLGKIQLPKQPWITRIQWYLSDVADALRRLFWRLWLGSAAIICLQHWAGGGWEPECCKGCPLKEKCKWTI